jgi:hypothetical protein
MAGDAEANDIDDDDEEDGDERLAADEDDLGD